MTMLQSVPMPAEPRASQLAGLTAVSCALLLLTCAWAAFDPRLLGEAPVWAKPMKFALSFVVLFGTLALVERRLSPAWRNGWMLQVTVAVMTVAMIIEMAYMILMAAQQEASHFNFSTPFTTLMYSIMGVGAVSLILGVAIFGVAVLRDTAADFSPALRWGIGWGCILSFALTLVTAGYMSSAGVHVGIEATGSPTLPLMGWSGTVGDIRPAHFLSLHAMQVLPLVGLWFDANRIGVQRIRWVALAYVAATAVIFAQALVGLPLIHL